MWGGLGECFWFHAVALYPVIHSMKYKIKIDNIIVYFLNELLVVLFSVQRRCVAQGAISLPLGEGLSPSPRGRLFHEFF